MKKESPRLSHRILILALLVGVSGLAAGAAHGGQASGLNSAGTSSVIYLPLVMRDAGLPEPVIPDTTEILSETTTQYLASVSGDGAELTFTQSTPELDEVSPGEVIVSGAIPNAPNGFLRKVTDISSTGGQVIVTTEDATLEEAIEDGGIQVTQTLSPDDIQGSMQLAGVVLEDLPQVQTGFDYTLNSVVLYDDDGDPGTTNDQITADGSIALDLGFDFRAVIRGFQLKELSFSSDVTETALLQISADVEYPLVRQEVEIARHYFSPIVFSVGPVPVVIVPVLTINVGVDGSVHVGVSTDVTQQATLTAGALYDGSAWSPVSSFSNQFQFNPPSLSTDLNLKGYAGAQIALMLYGVTGPHAEVNAYLELEADVLATPWWQLYGGLEVPIGVELEIFSQVIASYETSVIDYRVLIAQEGGTPTPTPTVTPTPANTATPPPGTPTSTPPPGSPGLIAFVSDRDGNDEIYIMNSDGTGQTNLTNNPGSDGSPVWSPDGTKIAFSSDRDGDREVYVMNADGTGVANLTSTPGNQAAPSWSPDGTSILFVSSDDGDGEIYVMNFDGTGQTKLTDNSTLDQRPAWSPDASRIAYEFHGLGEWEIYVMNADGSGKTNLTSVPGGGNFYPDWSPDGSKIVFQSSRDGNAEIYVMNAAGTGQTNLTNSSAVESAPLWSPDGTRIAFLCSDNGFWDVCIMNSDGTGRANLTNNSETDFGPTWSPDGTKIAFYSYRDSDNEIYVMNADGTGQINLTNNPAWDSSPVWQPR